MIFDLLLKNGLIPGGGTAGLETYDVGIRRGAIVAVEADLPVESAVRVVDCTGMLVVPGLVDLHTHIYRGATVYGIDHRALAWRSGVTTWVDAGSAGAYGIPGFREFIAEPSATTVRALINVSSIGLVAPSGECGELRNLSEDLAVQAIMENADMVAGVKVRMSGGAVGTNGLEPLHVALRIADRCGLPVMVHIGNGPPSLEDVVERLRPGDILTHCYTGADMRLIDERDKVRPCVRAARERGVLFDVGHGASSFSFEVAETLAEQGFWPDTISSDVHQHNVLGPVFDLPTIMNKFLALGMPVDEVVRAATRAPAAALSLPAGLLTPGQRADVAVFRIEDGHFPYVDSLQEERRGTRRLVNVATYVGGRELPPMILPDPATWARTTEHQQRWRSSATERQRWSERTASAERGAFRRGPLWERAPGAPESGSERR